MTARATRITAANPKALRRAWLAFRELIGVMTVQSGRTAVRRAPRSTRWSARSAKALSPRFGVPIGVFH